MSSPPGRSTAAEPSARAGRAAAFLLLALVLVLIAPGAASGAARTVHLRYGPVALEAAGLQAHVSRVQAPHLRGLITRMHAYAVDDRGRALSSDRVMLHHAVFRRVMEPQYDPDCNTSRDSEPFYATGEEDETLRLPAGYGMRVGRRERWLMRWMLMNHTDRAQKVFIRYDVRIETSRKVIPVMPLWLRVVSCREEYFDVPGGGGPGSVFTRSRTITAARTGRIITATGHLHGGAIGLTLAEPRCGNRALVTARPVYRSGTPQLHDGPVKVTSFSSPVGIPVFRGQQLELTAAYDNSERRDHVMGTMHVYVALDRPPSFDCGPLPPG
jgi:stress up-regulated protein Nod 19